MCPLGAGSGARVAAAGTRKKEGGDCRPGRVRRHVTVGLGDGHDVKTSQCETGRRPDGAAATDQSGKKATHTFQKQQ